MPEDLLLACVKRLRVLALLYAFVFFMTGVFPPLVNPDMWQLAFGDPVYLVPVVTSIATALLVAGITMSPRFTPSVILNVGVAFEIVGSFGIAAAEYLDVTAQIMHQDLPGGFGLSWVAVWVMIFTIVVPSAPRKALLAAIAATSAVPLTVGLAMRYDVIPIAMPPVEFFFLMVFPYMLVVLMAYVGARVLYHLGTEVSRAREMGSYRLVERLGSGGMGEVWRAKHRMLARPAAIKLVRPEVLGASDHESQRVLLTRFEREAQATASMRSPHTISLYDFGISDDGTFYYVAELLDGFDLEKLVKQFGPIPAERAIHLLRQVCHSLAEAHENELIHRDINPANIYACRYGRDMDFVKVLDFGIVKERGERRDDELKLTAEGVISGTPTYMAPEQILGDRPVDGRTDIYALGCVAYWLVTGRLVFEAETALQMVMQHVQQQPIPPSQRTELEIPSCLDSAILACLEKDPDGRPQSADELRSLLDTCAREVTAWTTERARQWWDTHALPGQ